MHRHFPAAVRTLTANGLFLTWTLLMVGAPSVVASTFSVDTTDDTPDANVNDGRCADADGNCSLRAAVQQANARGEKVTIHLAPRATYILSHAGAGEDAALTGDLDVTDRIVLRGEGAVVDAAGLDRAFDVQPHGEMTVDNLTVINGSVMAESGGAFRSAGELLLRNVTIRACVAAGDGASGGAIFNNGGELAGVGLRISQCSAVRAGGGIEANAGETYLGSSRLEDNHAGPGPGNGGGFHLTGAGVVVVESCRLSGNTAAREGGGLWNSGSGDLRVSLSHLTNNTAAGEAADDGGGGLFNDGGLLRVRFCLIEENTASAGAGSGGGIFNNDGTLIVELSIVEDNVSQRAGGGIEVVAGNSRIVRSWLIDNATGAAPGNGGALHLTGGGDVFVEQCLVSDNTASAEGGGLWNSAVGSMEISRTTFRNNAASGADADQGGGGVFNDGGEMVIASSYFSRNVADGESGSGGGALNNMGALMVSDSTFSRNSSQRAGGGIEANAGATAGSRIWLFGNATGANPGNGGGFHLTGAGLVILDRGVVFGNEAANEGGGLWNSSSGTMIVASSFVLGNRAPVGRNNFNDGGTFTLNGNPID